MANLYDNLRGYNIVDTSKSCWSCKGYYKKPGTLPTFCGICGREIPSRTTEAASLLLLNNSEKEKENEVEDL